MVTCLLAQGVITATPREPKGNCWHRQQHIQLQFTPMRGVCNVVWQQVHPDHERGMSDRCRGRDGRKSARLSGPYNEGLWPWWFHWSKDSKANSFVTSQILVVCFDRTLPQLIPSKRIYIPKAKDKTVRKNGDKLTHGSTGEEGGPSAHGVDVTL